MGEEAKNEHEALWTRLSATRTHQCLIKERQQHLGDAASWSSATPWDSGARPPPERPGHWPHGRGASPTALRSPPAAAPPGSTTRTPTNSLGEADPDTDTALRADPESPNSPAPFSTQEAIKWYNGKQRRMGSETWAPISAPPPAPRDQAGLLPPRLLHVGGPWFPSRETKMG